MNELLRVGQTLFSDASRQPCKVEEFLGGGGQGEVYRVTWGGRPYALKWYFPHTGTAEQRAALEKLVAAPPPSDRFLWPEEIATAQGVPAFGYLMRLREPRYKSIDKDLMKARIDPTFHSLVSAGLQLADSFYRLHADGLCYRDISFGNAFIDPESGEVLVCDNDNVAPNRTPVSGVLGTPDFMAPEIVRGEALPSRQTDHHSLAVLLFYMLHITHPLCGRRMMSIRVWDLPAREKMLGKEPLFIFDPSDRSNEAVDETIDPYREAGTNALKYWPLYPKFLRDTFVKAFTSGLSDPEHGRVLEGEWQDVLSRLRDSIFYCGCGKENFYDPDSVKASGTKTPNCWSCKAEVRLPYRIRIGKNIIMLTHRAKLYPHHLDEHRQFDFSTVLAEVARHPTDPKIWGLKNCTPVKWVMTGADGITKEVDPGRSAVLAANSKIRFGQTEGEIRY
jgi:DNA-binding helix-hairpin-helix protein with protein kinase domain